MGLEMMQKEFGTEIVYFEPGEWDKYVAICGPILDEWSGIIGPTLWNELLQIKKAYPAK